MDILIIDNGSTDGTASAVSEIAAVIEPGLRYFSLGNNSGGAGGYCFGIRKAAEEGYHYIWTMDDDCIPAPDALEKLMEYERKHPDESGFLSSKVLWTDGTPCKMNIPRESVFRPLDMNKNGCPEVKMASFVSLLIPARVIMDVGLPFRKFFIWTDDWEYTRRISRKYTCRLISESTVIHDMDGNRRADISTDDDGRVWRYKYLYRNDIYLYRREGLRGALYQTVRLPVHIVRVAASSNSVREKAKRIGIILRGTAEGMSFFPDPEVIMTAGEITGTQTIGQLKVLEAFGEPFSYGGQEAFVMNVLDNMDRSGMTLDVLTPYYSDNDSYAKRVREYGGEVYSLGCRFNPGGIRLNTLSCINHFLRTHHYDVIHIHSGSSSMLALFSFLAHSEGIGKIIVHSHSTGNPGVKHIAAKTAALIPLEKYPTDWCACSEEAGAWRFSHRICTERLCVIYDGIDAERFRFNKMARDRTRVTLGITDKTVLIGNVGRLTLQKNQSFLIDLLMEIRKRAGKEYDYRLLLVGSGEEEDDLKKQAASLGLTDYVLLAGTTDDVRDYYQAMDVLAMPSLYEGYGMVIAEGQAAGLEVIASDRVPKKVHITDTVSFLPLEDRETWISSLMKTHVRHPENADIIKDSEFSIRSTAEAVRDLYFQ